MRIFFKIHIRLGKKQGVHCLIIKGEELFLYNKIACRYHKTE